MSLSNFSFNYDAAKSTQINCVEWLLVHEHDGQQHTVCLSMADVFVALTLVVIVIMTVVGNTLVVLSVAIYKRMRTFTNVLLVSLATADFLVGVLIMPIALVDLMQSHHWTFGRVVCKLWTTSDVFLCTASILNLCVISLDRYFAITNPLIYTRTRSHKLAIGLVASVWLLSMVTCSPPLLVPGWQFQFEPFHCGYVKAIAYRIYSALCSFYIPLLIMLSVYLKIFRVANSREKMLMMPNSACGSESGSSRRSTSIWRGSSMGSCQGSTIRSTTSVVGQYKTITASKVRSGSKEDRPSITTPVCRPRNVEALKKMHEIFTTEDADSIDLCNESSNIYECEKPSSSDAEVLVTKGGKRLFKKSATVIDGDERSTNNTPLFERGQSVENMASPANNMLKRARKKAVNGGGGSRQSREKLIYLKERKALKTIGIVVSGFIVCWLPFFVLYIVEVVCYAHDEKRRSELSADILSTNFAVTNASSAALNLTHTFRNATEIAHQEVCQIPSILADIFLWLGYSNSGLNPLIYTFYHKDYRRCFKDLLSAGCLRRKVNRRMSVRRLHQTRL